MSRAIIIDAVVGGNFDCPDFGLPELDRNHLRVAHHIRSHIFRLSTTTMSHNLRLHHMAGQWLGLSTIVRLICQIGMRIYRSFYSTKRV